MESDDIDDSLAVEDMRSMYKGCMDEGKYSCMRVVSPTSDWFYQSEDLLILINFFSLYLKLQLRRLDIHGFLKMW